MNGDGRQPFAEREEFLETSGDLYISLRNTLQLLEAEMELLTEIDEAPGLRSASPACATSSNSCSNRTPATWSIGWNAAPRLRVPKEPMF